MLKPPKVFHDKFLIRFIFQKFKPCFQYICEDSTKIMVSWSFAAKDILVLRWLTDWQASNSDYQPWFLGAGCQINIKEDSEVPSSIFSL